MPVLSAAESTTGNNLERTISTVGDIKDEPNLLCGAELGFATGPENHCPIVSDWALW